MQVAKMTEDKWKARDKYSEYRKASQKFPRVKQYQTLKKAYRALAQGRTVIDLLESLRMGGVDSMGRPKLAIVRADFTKCWFSTSGENARFHGTEWPDKAADRVVVPMSVFGPQLSQRRIRAVVPMVPPRHLPAESLDHFHILWEANWETVPVDPMLLKHISGPLYTVLAAWDLTPLEQAVLRAAQ